MRLNEDFLSSDEISSDDSSSDVLSHSSMAQLDISREFGIDILHIRFVIHVSEPRTSFNYSQKSGRAGRDGRPSKAIVVWGRMKGQNDRVAGDGWVGGGLVKRYLHAGCTRVVLDEYLDGRVDRERYEAGEEACEGCGGRVDGVERREEMVDRADMFNERRTFNEHATSPPGDSNNDFCTLRTNLGGVAHSTSAKYTFPSHKSQLGLPVLHKYI